MLAFTALRIMFHGPVRYSMRSLRIVLVLLAAGLFVGAPPLLASGGHGDGIVPSGFPLPLADYDALEAQCVSELGRPITLAETLVLRVKEDPFNLVATVVFLLAVIHTFLCAKFTKLAHRIDEAHRAGLVASGIKYPADREPVSFKAAFYHLLGEVEAVFGLWLVPLGILLFFAPNHGWDDLVGYIDTRNFTEPVFVVVVMVIASSRPIVFFARTCLRQTARLGKESPLAWWLSILLITPLLGSFITEPAAMTIAALLLARQFYIHRPSVPLQYATLGLLFVGISVGGTLTHFAAPPVLMVAGTWHWDTPFMLTRFGWRAVIGIALSVSVYLIVFRKELLALGRKAASGGGTDDDEAGSPKVPLWVTLVHAGFLAWTVANLHHPALFVIGFLFFLAFSQATDHYQSALALRGPVLVGFFLAALVIHGGLQGWWIAPVLADLGEIPLFFTGVALTAFNDNAAITYLGSQVPAFSPWHLVDGVMVSKEGAELAAAQALQYALVAGAVAGGGLTVIANAPNPAGQSLLGKYFGDGGISPGGLLLGALLPTVIMIVCFIVLPH